MPYCTLADVQSRVVHFTITSSTRPSQSTIEGWIVETSRAVDSALRSAGYEIVPATGDADVELLRGLVANKVALQTIYVALGANNVPATDVEMLAGFREWIKDLRAGNASLIDQEPVSDNDPAFSIIRSPTRDDYFTERNRRTDWDE